jgi:hypothetical protein
MQETTSNLERALINLFPVLIEVEVGDLLREIHEKHPQINNLTKIEKWEDDTIEFSYFSNMASLAAPQPKIGVVPKKGIKNKARIIMGTILGTDISKNKGYQGVCPPLPINRERFNFENLQYICKYSVIAVYIDFFYHAQTDTFFVHRCEIF